MKESERLRAAKALIADEKNWMQGSYSDNLKYFEDSCKFCAIGAVHMVRTGHYAQDSDLNTTTHYLQRVLYANENVDVAEYNDSHSHADVMQMFDKAIELAESEGN